MRTLLAMIAVIIMAPALAGDLQGKWGADYTRGSGTYLWFSPQEQPPISAQCSKRKVDTLILPYPSMDVKPGAKAKIEVSDGKKKVRLKGEILDRNGDKREIGIDTSIRNAVFAMIASDAVLTVSGGRLLPDLW